jgi:hypothetical protein
MNHIGLICLGIKVGHMTTGTAGGAHKFHGNASLIMKFHSAILNQPISSYSKFQLSLQRLILLILRPVILHTTSLQLPSSGSAGKTPERERPQDRSIWRVFVVV